ncbi:triose-phosphate isomerase, partial [uncultured Bilophila sp.]|uniref:triose-phosphate isomerase n=1 Tax=uncultured Bilophila sp. TaxID=529385 RepID=UPI00280AEEC0
MNPLGSGRRANGAGIIEIPGKTRSFILWIWNRLGRIRKLRSREYPMRTIIAANWKMNKTRAEAKATAHELASILGGAPDDRDVVVFAPSTALDATREGLNG